MTVHEIASACYNDIVGGIKGYHSTPNIAIEQLEDEVINERDAVIKEMILKGTLSKRDFMLSINCIEVDCADPSKCCNIDTGKRSLHFEIPQLLNDLGYEAIEFIGSTDRQIQYKVYTSTSWQYHKYRKRGKDTPFVYIETTPNENGKYDGWIFNVPFVKYISVIGVFKDPRDLEEYTCCQGAPLLELNVLSALIQERITKKKLQYYKQLPTVLTPNTQTPE